jgi:hypothetical protein
MLVCNQAWLQKPSALADGASQCLVPVLDRPLAHLGVGINVPHAQPSTL